MVNGEIKLDATGIGKRLGAAMLSEVLRSGDEHAGTGLGFLGFLGALGWRACCCSPGRSGSALFLVLVLERRKRCGEGVWICQFRALHAELRTDCMRSSYIQQVTCPS